MSRENLGKGKHGKTIFRPTINVPWELAPMAPEGSDPGACYLEQALRIFRDFTGYFGIQQSGGP
eukprot:1726545-Alexandrium_andersonii.AAC.1